MSGRRTIQRSAIIEVIYDATGPLRLEEILELASRKVPTLGIATVYRHLKRLQDAGEVRAVELDINDVRYEPTGQDHHHHFLCRACGDAFNIHECPKGIAKLALPGFEVDEHQVTLYGRCSDCSSSK